MCWRVPLSQEESMARVPKPKIATAIRVAREGGTYHLRIQDEAGKVVHYEMTADHALRLADTLDGLLADEEAEELAAALVAQEVPTELERFGTVKWYNVVKGFGFITPDGGGEDLFMHRSTLEQAGMTEISDGARVRITVSEGQKGPTVSAIELA
jgi:cold shock CspA family protein